MGRIAIKSRNNKTMSESAFFGWIRAGLRRHYMRGWKPSQAVAKENRRTVSRGRMKYEYICNSCQQWFPRTEIQVDHIQECGSLRSWEDLAIFSKRLFVEKEGLQVLCTECHNKKTNEYRNQ